MYVKIFCSHNSLLLLKGFSGVMKMKFTVTLLCVYIFSLYQFCSQLRSCSNSLSGFLNTAPCIELQAYMLRRISVLKTAKLSNTCSGTLKHCKTQGTNTHNINITQRQLHTTNLRFLYYMHNICLLRVQKYTARQFIKM